MFAVPSLVIPVWPWLLTPLTCRVVGAVFCLGSAGLVVLRDSRWVRLRLMVEVEVVMLTLILVGAVRGRSDLYTDRPRPGRSSRASPPRSGASLWLWRAHGPGRERAARDVRATGSRGGGGGKAGGGVVSGGGSGCGEGGGRVRRVVLGEGTGPGLERVGGGGGWGGLAAGGGGLGWGNGRWVLS